MFDSIKKNVGDTANDYKDACLGQGKDVRTIREAMKKAAERLFHGPTRKMLGHTERITLCCIRKFLQSSPARWR